MKTLDRYVFGSFLSSFFLAFVVLTFVLTIGLMVQIVGYILDGVPMSLVGEFALVSFPETMQWTMPLALLVASVLVFSRMSADCEISAMRACGVNLLGIMKWPLAFGVVCTLLGVYVNNEIVPRGHEVRRTLKEKVSVSTGLDVLKPGRVIGDFPNVKVYFGAKEGNWLYDLVVLDYSDPKGVERMITATKALVTSEGRDVSLDLYDMTVDPLDADHPTMAHATRFQYVIPNALKNSKYTKRDKDLRFSEAVAKLKKYDKLVAKADPNKKMRVQETEKLFFLRVLRERSNLRVEFSKRFVFAMASLCFVLVGIPLGIKAQRKESTIGMAISLAISLVYYMVVILMLGLEDHAAIHPEILIWLAPLVCFGLASRLVPKNL